MFLETFSLLSPILKSYLSFKGTSLILILENLFAKLINKSATTEKSFPIKKFFFISLLFFKMLKL